MRRFVSTALFLAFALAGDALAFSADGHFVVCRIAYLELKNDPDVRKRIDELIALYRDPDGKPVGDFAAACKFPDVARIEAGKPDRPAWTKAFKKFDRWHFLNVPRDTHTVSVAHCGDDCVLEGIDYHTRGLTLSGLSENLHAQALLFLGHWIGDLHQPLHVSFSDDQGGNLVLLTKDSFYKPFVPTPPEKERPVNLHGVWDSRIITTARGGEAVEAFAQSLEDAITDADREKWRAGTAVDWAQESYEITTSKDTDYCEWIKTDDGDLCNSEAGPRTLTKNYQNEFDDVVKQRLQQAGVRLAAQIRKGLGL